MVEGCSWCVKTLPLLHYCPLVVVQPGEGVWSNSDVIIYVYVYGMHYIQKYSPQMSLLQTL